MPVGQSSLTTPYNKLWLLIVTGFERPVNRTGSWRRAKEAAVDEFLSKGREECHRRAIRQTTELFPRQQASATYTFKLQRCQYGLRAQKYFEKSFAGCASQKIFLRQSPVYISFFLLLLAFIDSFIHLLLLLLVSANQKRAGISKNGPLLVTAKTNFAVIDRNASVPSVDLGLRYVGP